MKTHYRRMIMHGNQSVSTPVIPCFVEFLNLHDTWGRHLYLVTLQHNDCQTLRRTCTSKPLLLFTDGRASHKIFNVEPEVGTAWRLKCRCNTRSICRPKTWRKSTTPSTTSFNCMKARISGLPWVVPLKRICAFSMDNSKSSTVIFHECILGQWLRDHPAPWQVLGFPLHALKFSSFKMILLVEGNC